MGQGISYPGVMMIANRLQALKPSPTLMLSQKASDLKAQGRDIINLTVGEPDFPTPSWICDGATAAMAAGQTKYTAVGGTPALKNAIIKKLERDNHLTYSAAEVVVSCGAKQVIFNAMMATLNPGDEVIIPAPYWVSYPEMVTLFSGNPVIVSCPQAQEFKMSPEDLEAAITPKTKWLILNSPSNPTGTAYSYEELWKIAQVLRRHPQVMILCDDIYEHLMFDGEPFHTLADVEKDLKSRTLIVNGVSKTYSMTGWRLGYGAGPSWLIQAMTDIQSQSTSNACSIAQAAAVAALEGPQDFIQEWRQSFQDRRNYVVERLNQIPGVECLNPQGAFYVFPDCLDLMGRKTPQGDRLVNDTELCAYLLEVAEVAMVPGSAFGMPNHLRLSYAVSLETLQKACDRLERVISSFQISDT